MAIPRHEQLLNFVPSYRAGYVSSGGRDEDLKDDEEVVKKMDAVNVQTEAQAEKAGRDEGFKVRQQR